jgi:kanamycin kinase
MERIDGDAEGEADATVEVGSGDDWSRTPTGPVEVPAAAATIARGSSLRCVWQNSLGGLTFEVADGSRFLKWAPVGSPLRLLEEAERMRWAHRYSPVPDVLDAGTADDGSTWLLTAALPGTTAVADRWKASPRVAVCALGEGLRAFHEALPVAECPFTWSAEERVVRAQAGAKAGVAIPALWHPSHRHLTLDEALAVAAEPPPVDRLVVCHADSCAPNTLVGDDGRWSGHVDLGRMGTGDRWADLAVATWSTGWNYGAGWGEELLDAYGVGPDIDRIRYYRLLWDLTD